ncbi:flagellar hook-associated protein FlgK [Pseudooceanicola nanhaiensis]|uniref:flagellar hook-associated protein FlgK n=1 Tax=Pseudooceanicola nanhaiensis TaxID=375761 RepID=UPI001CD201C3|nr:flagellar hook-associated protein FlgK [Pseudooceanicola nanhaiensis]MCA0922621.1 flagellar hook-associated protein FlgK [Pseudooceanicola nanhaiensis]
MSISNAFATSRSGLMATSTWAEVTSTNIANATTDGYASRSVTMTTSTLGDVAVTGVTRSVSTTLTAMVRREYAAMGTQEAISSGLEIYSTLLGGTDSDSSLTTKLGELQSNLVLLAADPSDSSRQRAVVTSAQSLAEELNTLSSTLESSLETTQDSLTSEVSEANSELEQLAALNAALKKESGDTERRASLLDQQDKILDSLSERMDITVTTESDGQITLRTSGGTELLRGDRAETLEYDKAAGTLSVNGTDITPGETGKRGFDEGRIAGLFTLQNTTLPEFQSQLDEVARALIEGFTALDDTLATGEPGLFTDAGAAYDASDLTGLAGRITVNSAVLPEEGGALWRLRDGIGADEAGTVAGEAGLINSYIDLLEGEMSFSAEAGLGDTATLTDYVVSLTTSQQTTLSSAESELESLSTSATTLETSRQNIQGVNLDDELIQLTAIQQAYAANSQVLTTLTEMIDSLLEAV